MKPVALALTLALTAPAFAQTAPKATKPAAPSSTAKASTAATHKPAASAAAYKLPPDEKRIPGIPKVAFSLRYQDIKPGTGPEAESGKLWHVKYKGWRAADGVVFDAWDKHGQPVMGPDGKPLTGPDGKPKMTEPQPMMFPQGVGRMIPGFDFGLTGMRVGGKRRLFIPWQLAYGTRTIPDRGADHPGIPAKSDLIFDVELVEVTDMPQPPQRPMPPMQPAPGNPQGAPSKPTTPPTPPPAATPGAPGSPGTPSAPSTPGSASGVHATTPAPDTQAAPKAAPQPQTDQNKPQ